MQSIKEHNLKANHNLWRLLLLCLVSVCNLSKNTIWKQITTFNTNNHNSILLYAIYQRTQSESKSQRITRCCCSRCICMQSIKEHNLKANHNLAGIVISIGLSVCNLSKNTIWKQITTIKDCWKEIKTLYAIYQRTQSESKSQQCWGNGVVSLSVCNLSKNTIWKQITTKS